MHWYKKSTLMCLIVFIWFFISLKYCRMKNGLSYLRWLNNLLIEKMWVEWSTCLIAIICCIVILAIYHKMKTTKTTNMLGSRPTIIISMKEECEIESGLIINSTSCNNYHHHLFPLTLVSDENNQNISFSFYIEHIEWTIIKG